MNKNLKFFLIVFMLFSRFIYAEDMNSNIETSGDKEKIIVYFFQDESKSDLYKYYSSIIPDSIKSEIKSMDKADRYEIKINTIVFTNAGNSGPEKDFNRQTQLLADKGKELSADYIITGSYFVEKSSITIKTQLFDVSDQQLTDIEEITTRQEAFFVEIIENITQMINYLINKSFNRKKNK